MKKHHKIIYQVYKEKLKLLKELSIIWILIKDLWQKQEIKILENKLAIYLKDMKMEV